MEEIDLRDEMVARLTAYIRRMCNMHYPPVFILQQAFINALQRGET